jgi:hypothetical protein
MAAKFKLSPSYDTSPPGAGAGASDEHAHAPGGPVLGSNAKYSAARETIDPETGEIVGVARLPADLRFERFALQAAARRVLPNSRTAKCLRLRAKGRDIQVVRSQEHKSCSYKGLQTCGSVWACPVCAAKISERRRIELQAAMALHQAQGGQVLLATFTTPHHLGDQLDQVLSGQAKALSYLNGDRAGRALFSDMGCVGQVRALEVTHGRKRAINNGWHPHYHVLLFVRPGLDLAGLQARLLDRWVSACLRAGLKAPNAAHGVRLDDGSMAAAYASKWGLDAEMTKGHIKVAKDGETPFDFLRAYLEDGDKQAAALFAEFAKVFKGKRQLHWSRGLKKRFGIGDVSDEELAQKQDDQAVLLGSISLEQWRAVLRHEGRAIVLELAEKQGWEAVEGYIGSIILRGQNAQRVEGSAVSHGDGERSPDGHGDGVTDMGRFSSGEASPFGAGFFGIRGGEPVPPSWLAGVARRDSTPAEWADRYGGFRDVGRRRRGPV